MRKASKSAKAAHKTTEALDSVTSSTDIVAVPVEAVSIQNIADIPLTPAETELLAKCEATIGKGIKSFQEVFGALLIVSDQRLYRADHATFEDYCRIKWDITSRHANRLMLAGGVVKNLKSDQLVSSVTAAIPENEAQARPLTPLTPPQQIEAARIVAKKPGKHTTKDFEEAAQKVSGKKPKDAKTSKLKEYEEEPRVQSYDPREDKADGETKAGVKGKTKSIDNSDLEMLLEFVDQAQTQARKVVGGSDLVKMLGDVAKEITRRLNGGGK
jgi:hypothetical protein